MRESILVTSLELLKAIEPEVLNADFLAVDTETDGIHRFCRIVGLAFAASEDKGYYIPILVYRAGELKSPWKPEAAAYVESFARKLLSKRNLIMHNAVFDCKVFSNWLGVSPIKNVYCDTQLLAHTVYSEEGPLGLKPLAAKLIDPEAANPQKDVAESVKAAGGKTTKEQFDMYMADYRLLGRYGTFDVMYTYGLFNRLYPEIERQGLQELWNLEVLPLLPVAYDLNTVGVRIDTPYFEQLREDVKKNITDIESQIYGRIRSSLVSLEFELIKKKIKVTKRSEVGKLLELAHDEDQVDKLNAEQQRFVVSWYKQKNNCLEVLNLDSGDHKAKIIYDILGYTCTKRTDSGKPATDADTLEELEKLQNPNKDILALLLKRAAEIKLLSTYIEGIVKHQVDGVIYTGFNQTATVSGRFSSSRPLNLQTLPRDDKRIKKGFHPQSGWVFIGDDYSSLEPRSFASVSNEQRLKDIFINDEDFYSRIAIDQFKLEGVSAREEDKNFLKHVRPEYRQWVKQFALAVPYGASGGRVAQMLNLTFEEGQKLVDDYLNTYPALKAWMQDSEEQAYTLGYVTTITGRKRRTPLLHELYRDYKVSNFSKKNLQKFWDWARPKNLQVLQQFEEFTHFYLECRNSLNNAKNVQIQGLAASICNAAMIDFKAAAERLGLQAKIIMQVHDEIIVTCPEGEAEQTAKLLQNCMENNRVTKMVDVPMRAEPVITNKSLAEAK